MLLQKTISIIVIIIIGIAINLTIIKFLLSKVYKINDNNPFVSSSFLTELISMFLASLMLFTKSIYAIDETFEIVYKLRLANPFFEVLKATSLYFGLDILWFVAFYFISIPLTSILFENTNQKIEMEKTNYTFFIIKGLILTGLVIASLSLQESVYRSFIPSISTPIFH